MGEGTRALYHLVLNTNLPYLPQLPLALAANNQADAQHLVYKVGMRLEVQEGIYGRGDKLPTTSSAPCKPFSFASILDYLEPNGLVVISDLQSR